MMYTLFDFVTQVKGAEYLIAVSAIGLFILLWEALKPRPFKAMMETAREDLKHISQAGGSASVLRTAGHVVAAPFLVIGYVAALPFVFMSALSLVIVDGVSQALDVSSAWIARRAVSNWHALTRTLGATTSFSWRPQEAYFLGRKRRQAKDKGKDKDKKED
jgi:hypothetical protein